MYHSSFPFSGIFELNGKKAGIIDRKKSSQDKVFLLSNFLIGKLHYTITITLLHGTIVYLVYLCAVVGLTGLHLADLTQLRGDQETRLELQQLGGTSWWRPKLWQGGVTLTWTWTN